MRAVLVVVLLGVVYLGVTFVQVYRASTRDEARPAQAIVVLGAAQYDGRPSPVLRQRLDHAHALWERGLAPVIVVTGGSRPGDRFTEAQAGYTYLRERGVPDEDLLMEVEGTNTWEELAASARFLRRRDITDVLLVSDGYHAYRLGAIAEELGLDAAVSPTRSTQSFGGRFEALVRETGAVAVGRLIGYRRLVRLDEAVTSAGP